MECLFCKMLKGQLKIKIIAQNDDYFAIYDINPKAKVHVLLISKVHRENFVDYFEDHQIKSLVEIIKEIITIERIAESGYKLVSNTGENAGQSIHHFHIHILGGEPLGCLV